jgi:DNA-binding transcriptional MocR family regulator
MQQIVDKIEAQILGDGAFGGCRLPPIRVLAHQLGVSKNTVSAAYEELKAKGLVDSLDRQGLFVATPERTVKAPQAQAVPLPALRPLPRVRPPIAQDRHTLHLSSVFIDPELLPMEKISSCFRSVLKTPGLANFADPQGYRPLRQWIAARLKKRGIDATPDHIVTTIGSQQVLDLICRTLATPRVATENPAYHLGKALFDMNRVELIGLPVNPFTGPDLDAWDRMLGQHRPALVYLTPNFQNPTGYSYSTAELGQILALARKHQFGILEDDWGSDMLSYSEFKPSLRALGGENVLYMNTFTKKLLPSLRLGYIVGNAATLPALLLSKRVSISAIPTVAEAALFEFLDRGYYDAHLQGLQKELDARYRHCLDCLRTHMPPEVQWTTPGGGPILWMECPRSVNLKELAAEALRRKVIVLPATEAFFGEPHLHGFQIGYAFLPPEAMAKGISILADVLKKSLILN